MAFKPINYFRKGRGYLVGEGTERVAHASEMKTRRKMEKEMFEEDTNHRMDLNRSISQKISQEWPEEEIQVAIEREFPNESPARIKALINHWQEQARKMLSQIDILINKVKIGQATQSEADKKMGEIYKHYNTLKKLAKNYYSRKIDELGDDER